MNSRPDNHLTYDQHLKALVDPADIDADRQAHLQACVHCQQQAAQLSQRFQRIGQMARKLAPEPSRPFRLPAQARQRRSSWQFKPVMAMGMIAVLVLAFTIFWPQRFDPNHLSPEQLAQQAQADARLMAEIDDLVKDALPKAYRELAMVEDNGLTDLSPDLIDWIVPTIEEDEEPIDPRA